MAMKFERTEIEGVMRVLPRLHQDERGIFRRTFCQEELAKGDIYAQIIQVNISENPKCHTLRGLHYQLSPFEEQKLITCISGEIFNIVLDLRPKSSTYRRWTTVTLCSVKRDSLFIPTGCANGFLTMKPDSSLLYLMGAPFNEAAYRGIRYNDPQFGFKWPCAPECISKRDQSFPDFKLEQ
jgi:dTDP-4-dehydrorhamnose 3,5-epimerase